MNADVPLLPAQLADLAGVREQVLDEHMHRLPPKAGRRVTFRLQLFTAPGLRPVAIATQMPGAGEGASLTNAAKTCAASVWQQYFPDDPEPPIWVAHMIIDGLRNLVVVTFTADSAGHTLRAPQWRRVSPAAIDTLVGRPVDLERGDGFTPPEIEPDPESTWVAQPVILLPRPEPFREDGCMAAGVPWWRRLGRQLVPRRGGRDCCWYHGGDWHLVSRLAIRLAARARSAGVGFDDTPSYVLDHSDAQGLSEWEREALFSLMVDTIRPYAPWPRREGYNNGQHRAQALLDAGVRRVLIERGSD
ncbi:hypothetical protein I0C86_13760 [Plantactinospora sp. S1510]|uniref:Uncharacterized protein n=1 Tax=Plantactinospora alkalitolerans TaxID=2789879 RepID=A0ABS0GUY2_9ACTN|nr:hypothetical protein [Plantactinospora alkalitolerans]MBF9130016.1 hypothetical protein [Plantactinospora alkalitolerans]